jgi:hypothetical protein
MAKSIYEPLLGDQIRLLELDAGNGDEDLKGRLRHVPLDSPGKYEALSYVWGSDNKSCH